MFFLRFFFALGCFLGLVSTVRAMEVRPPILEVSARAGASTTTVFLLRNPEPVSETYVFTIQGFVSEGDEGRQTFLPFTETTGLPSWLYLSRSVVTLKPYETVPVSVTFRPPVESRAGAYQAVVFANQANPEAGGSVTLGSRVGVLVFATVEGEVRRALSIPSFSRQGPKVVSHLPVSFSGVVRNEGEAHEVLGGHVQMKDVLGRVVALVPMATSERVVRILPHSERRVALTWGETDAARGVWAELKAEWSPFALGWYRARLVFDQPTPVSSSEVSFFVLPWRTLLLALVGAALLGFFRWRRA